MQKHTIIFYFYFFLNEILPESQDSYNKFQLEANFFISVIKPWGKRLMLVLTDC